MDRMMLGINDQADNDLMNLLDDRLGNPNCETPQVYKEPPDRFDIPRE